MAPPPGYQIVEPPSLGKLNAYPSQKGLAVAVLTWAIDRAKSQSKELFGDDVSVEVIPVCYLGAYPAVGIRYFQEDPQDRGPAIEDAIDKVIRSMSMVDFISFAEKSNVPWHDVWKEMENSIDTRLREWHLREFNGKRPT